MSVYSVKATLDTTTSDKEAEKQAARLADALPELEETVLSAASYKLNDAEWRVEIHTDGAPDIAQLGIHTKMILGYAPQFEVAEIDPDIDWVAQTLSTLKPIEAGRFFVYGSHDADKLPDDKIGIEIEAALAFGTGKHETTFGCLQAIDTLEVPHKNVLDLGCGSAILAIAYAKKFAPTPPPVMATDIDPVSIEQAQINLHANHVAGQIETLAADGMAHELIQNRAPFDLVLANILANPLVTLAPDIAHACTPDATLILSGLLERQTDMVMDAYTPFGFNITQRFNHAEWACLMLQRGEQ